MYKKNQFYCLTPEWQEEMARKLQGKFIDDKIITFPETLGRGSTFFIQIVPGIAAVLMDFVLAAPLKIDRIEDEIERYVFHFDLSEGENNIAIRNKNKTVGNAVKLGLSIFNNQQQYYFEPAIGSRVFVVRLFVDKKLMNELIENNPESENMLQKIKFSKKKLFYSSDIDSESLLMLANLREIPVTETSFDVHIKGIALKLLANVLLILAKPQEESNEMTVSEREGILKTGEYLSENVHQSFPSIQFLARIAGVCETRFKILFKKLFQRTSHDFFTQEKMILANKLLQSGDYKTLNEIIEELNYSSSNQFTVKYLKFFKRKPSEDFIRKYDKIKE